MRNLLILLSLCGLIACNSSNDGTLTASSITSEQEARDLSPIGEVCVHGEIETVFQPSNRGRGNNKGEYIEVDNRTYEPGFLLGDSNYDGVSFTREDAMISVKNLYVKMIEKELCPSVSDIGLFPQGAGSDGFFTSEDIYQWNQVKKTGESLLEEKIICLSDCAIINHMKPGNK